MAKISLSVGKGGKNKSPDVVTIRYLINAHIDQLKPLTSLQISTRSDKQLENAITKFQEVVVRLRNPDGRVDPGGRTLAALSRPGRSGSPLYYPPGQQEKLADIARTYIGATEGKGNRQGTDPRMKEIFEADYAKLTRTTTDGYAWCCSFVSLCTQKFLLQSPIHRTVNPPREASVRRFLELWAPAQKCLIFPPNEEANKPHKGDIVVFTFSHIGIVDSVSGVLVKTIEGNTNQSGSREGTVVRQQNRNLSVIRKFIRLPIPAFYDVVNSVCLA